MSPVSETVERFHERFDRPVFNPAYVPVRLDENSIHIRVGPFSGPAYTIEDDQREGTLGQLPRLLDGERDTEAVLEAFDRTNRTEIAAVLLELADNNIVYDAERVARTRSLPQLALRPQVGPSDRDRLETASVGVINDGRMGTQIAADLLESGVGSVRYVSVGREPEVRAVDSERLKRSDRPLADELEAVDVAVFATEDPAPTLASEFNEVAHEVGTPWLLAQVSGLDGFVGPTVFPGETACYECFAKRRRGWMANPDGYETVAHRVEGRADGVTAKTPALARLVAGYASLDLLNLASSGQAFTTEQAIVVDGLSLSVESNGVLKHPRCETCYNAHYEDVQRFVDRAARERYNSDGGGQA